MVSKRSTTMSSLKKLLATAALLAAPLSSAEKTEDMGTVIGIDLGTTYSW